MFKRKKPVLDEREMLEMYRIEHAGLWLMYALLCAGVLVQVLLGADLVQMAGELVTIFVVSAVMIVANMLHGIWDERSRPSLRGNAACALGVGVCVAVIAAIRRSDPLLGAASGLLAAALCFLALGALMLCMKRRQARAEKSLEEDG